MKMFNELISIPLDEFKFSYLEQYSFYPVIKKYKDNMVAFKMTRDGCYMLFKGTLKFFAAWINLSKRKITRVKDNQLGYFNYGKESVILDEKEFNEYKRMEIIKSLK